LAQVSTAATTATSRSRRAPSGTGRAAPRGADRGAPRGTRRAAPRPHLGRLALLALVLIGASFYVSPLRSFFQQQDRYNKAAAQLQAARQDNTALAREADLLITKAYIAQRARSDSMLVPPGTQVFVIKGLPGKQEEKSFSTATPPTESSISLLDRIDDLWRTLLH
jgi:cell division protein FtsB